MATPAEKRVRAMGPAFHISHLDPDTLSKIMWRVVFSSDEVQGRINNCATLRLVQKGMTAFFQLPMYNMTFYKQLKPREDEGGCVVAMACASVADGMGMAMFRIIQRGTPDMVLDAVKVMKQVSGAKTHEERLLGLSRAAGVPEELAEAKLKEIAASSVPAAADQ